MSTQHHPQLQVSQCPRLPLSSPISEESTPDRSAEASVGLEISFHSLQDPFWEARASATSGEDKACSGRYTVTPNKMVKEPTTSQRGPSTPSPRRRNGSHHQKRKPGLNIVTDFSKPLRTAALVDPAKSERHENTAARAPRLMTEHAAALEEQEGRSGFVDLHDLDGLRKQQKGRNLPTAIGRTDNLAFSGQKAARLVQGPEHQAVVRGDSSSPPKKHRSIIPPAFRPPREPANGISPTTRSVVIGITVPEHEVEAHRPSDEARSALTLITPATPDIVVTPADATTDWPRLASQHAATRRPASSMYSEATSALHKRHPDAPPVPSVPSPHKRDTDSASPRRRNSCDSWELDSQGTARPVSSGTIIDEDDAHGTEHRPRSVVSDEAILLPSCDIERPRSKGWWNLMLSPMLSRNSTGATKRGLAAQEQPPALPSPPSRMQNALVPDDSGIMGAISPETPRRAGLEDVRNSTWSNWTQWEEDRDQAATTTRESPPAGDDTQAKFPPGKESQGDGVVATEGATEKTGLAAEYYQASAFDLLNPDPYFQCVNHDCARALPELGGFRSGSAICLDAPEKTVESAAASRRAKDGLQKGLPRTEVRSRSNSDSTVIEDDMVKFSPNVRKALARPIIKATQVQQVETPMKEDPDEKEISETAKRDLDKPSVAAGQPAVPPPYSPSRVQPKPVRYVGILPPGRQVAPSNPGPLSPEGQRTMNKDGGMAMSQVQQPGLRFHTMNTAYCTHLPPRPAAAHVLLADIENPLEVRKKAEVRRRFLEQEEAAAHRAGGMWRGRGCVPKNGCFGRGGRPGRIRRRWYAIITTGLVLMIVLVVILATQLTRTADQTPVESQWLNLTGYPPMPTGISTVARPEAASVVTACVQPSSLWSCAVPREDQASLSPNDPDQPNFRFEIRFRNGTVDANDTIPLQNAIRGRSRDLSPRQSDPFTNSLFEPSPAAPSLEDQDFLGNTTDGVAVPFSGEETPFFITLLSTDPALPESFNDATETSQRRRRQVGSGQGTEHIPAPAILEDGTAAPANLVPQDPRPFSQPVKLYDRGLDTEHYGFYTYYDRSIFLKRSSQPNGSASSRTGNAGGADAGSAGEIDAGNADGGSTKQDADLRCTWAQTRFLVRIWTNPAFQGQRLGATNSTAPAPTDGRNTDGRSPQESSAANFTRPGSFPYPVSITLDRHGGDAAKKGVYCYGVGADQKIVVSDKKLVAEVRRAGAGGTSGGLINPAPGIFGDGGDGKGSGSGGVDGGVGGCSCEWRNWAGPGNGNGGAGL